MNIKDTLCMMPTMVKKVVGTFIQEGSILQLTLYP